MNQVTREAAREQTLSAQIASWRWGIVWLTFLATTLNYMDRQTLQSTATYIKADFGLDEEGYGWISFWFSLSYGLFQFPAGFLADRWNLRRLYVAALLVWSAAGFMIGMSDTVLMMSACRFVLGLGEAFNWPCAATIVRHTDKPSPIPLLFVVKKGSKTFSILSSGIPTPESRTQTWTPPSDGSVPKSRRRRSRDCASGHKSPPGSMAIPPAGRSRDESHTGPGHFRVGGILQR